MGVYRSVNSKLIIAKFMFFTVALSGRSMCKCMIPRVLPWAVDSLGFQPALVDL